MAGFHLPRFTLNDAYTPIFNYQAIEVLEALRLLYQHYFTFIFSIAMRRIPISSGSLVHADTYERQ